MTLRGIAGEPVIVSSKSAPVDVSGQASRLSAEDDAAYLACFGQLNDYECRKLHQFFSGGDYTPARTPSEDDLELAGLLIKGGIPQAEQVERIMRASGIARPKYDRRGDDYVKRTIRTAGKHFNARAGEQLSNALDTPSPKDDRPPSRTLAEIRENPDATKPRHTVLPFLAWAGHLTLVSATAGFGKSTLFAAGAASVTTGGAFLGEQCQQGPVLWVLVEEHTSDVFHRAVRFGTSETALHVLAHPAERMATLASEVRRIKPVLVVIDTLHTFASVEHASQGDEWNPLLTELRKLAEETNAAFLLSAQALKSSGEYKDSSTIGHLVDVVLTMRCPDRKGPVRILEQSKWRWDFPEIHCELVGNEYQRTTAQAANDDRRDDVRAALTAEWQTAAQVAVKLGNKKERSVRQDLAALYESELVERQGTGKKGDAFRFRIPARVPLQAHTCAGMNPDSGIPANAGIRQQPELDDGLPF